MARGNFAGISPVMYKITGANEAGQPTQLTLSVNYEHAPVPDHYYVCDYYQISIQGCDVLFVFGKLDHPRTDRLRNKVEILFPATLFVQQLWKGSREFSKSLASYLEQQSLALVGSGSISSETDKVQTLYSNNVLMIQSGVQCILDFFYLSEKDMWLKPPRNEPISIEALVRVMMQAPMLLGLLGDCDKVASELADAGIVSTEGEDAQLELQ
jgi:hypothetical protein